MGRQAARVLTVGAVPDFLLVPPAVDASASEAGLQLELGHRLPAALPPVWQDLFDCLWLAAGPRLQDLFDCLRRAAAPEYIAQVACAGSSGGAPAAEPGPLSAQTIFRAHLSPEALVQRHRLGLPEIKRLYQALQVYSLGFHQTVSETTAHALNKGHLLTALWRGFAMLWDGALQAVFASETVKLSKEQQAASLSADAAFTLLRECEAAKGQLAAENHALRERMEGMVVEMLSNKADASVLAQSAAAAEAEAKQLRKDKAAQEQLLKARSAEVLKLQARLQEVESPEQTAKAERLAALLEEKAGMLGAAARREAAAQQERDAAQYLARAERLKREEAQARAVQLQAQVDDLGLKLRALQTEHAQAEAAAADQQALQDRLALLAGADSQSEAWRARAEAAEAKAASLGEQLQQARNEELVNSVWPLAAKIKALEAQLAGGGSAGAG